VRPKKEKGEIKLGGDLQKKTATPLIAQ